jgi:GNAT superfamily N-acetyltransferase
MTATAYLNSPRANPADHMSWITYCLASLFATNLRATRNFHIFQVRTNRQGIFVRILNEQAVIEKDSSFKAVPRPKNDRPRNCRYVLLSKTKLIGYLSFTPKWRDGKPLLNQIYVTPTERRKGYATMLINHFVEENCDKSSDTWFIAESPNEKSYHLIVDKLKLGEKVKVVCLG